MCLSVSSDIQRLAAALLAHSRSRWARPSRLRARVEVLEAIPRVLPGELPLGEERRQPPPKGVARWVKSISTTSVTTRSRNRRSWLTSSTPAASPSTHASRRARPSRSRSLVGSSSRKTSNRESSSDGERSSRRLAAREHEVGWSSSRRRGRARPRRRRCAASKSAAPSGHPRSKRWCTVVAARITRGERGGRGVELVLSGGDARCGERGTHGPSPPTAFRLLLQQPTMAVGGASATGPPSRPSSTAGAVGRNRPASTASSVDLPTPFGPTSPIRSPGDTTRSTSSSTRLAPRATPSTVRAWRHQ